MPAGPFVDSLDESSDEKEQCKKLLEYLKSEGASFPQLSLNFNEKTKDRNTTAKTAIKKRCEIISIPKKLLITLDMAKASEVGQAITDSKYEVKSWHTYLAVFVLQERFNADSEFKTFLQAMPRAFPTVPLSFSAGVLQHLKGSMCLRKIAARKNELHLEFSNLCKYVPKFFSLAVDDKNKFTLDLFIWARTVVITRIFALHKFDNKSKNSAGLVPLADMLNHSVPSDAVWSYDNKKEAFVVTATTDIPKGAEINDSYGRKCNSRFLVNYGFALLENDDNEAAVSFGLDSKTDKFVPIKQRFLGSGKKRVFQIGMDCNSVSTKLLFSFLRVKFAQDSEMILFSAALGIVPYDVKPLSLKNELLVLNALESECERSLEGFETTIEKDEDILMSDFGDDTLPVNVRNCVIMRRGEKQVLLFYIALVRDCMALLECTASTVERQILPLCANKFALSYLQQTFLPLLSTEKHKSRILIDAAIKALYSSDN